MSVRYDIVEDWRLFWNTPKDLVKKSDGLRPRGPLVTFLVRYYTMNRLDGRTSAPHCRCRTHRPPCAALRNILRDP